MLRGKQQHGKFQSNIIAKTSCHTAITTAPNELVTRANKRLVQYRQQYNMHCIGYLRVLIMRNFNNLRSVIIGASGTPSAYQDYIKFNI